MKEKLDPKIWTDIDKLVEKGPPPQIPIKSMEVIRNATPAERMADWLMRGWLPLFLTTLLFLLLLTPSLSPGQTFRVTLLAVLVSWLVVPLAGRQPSATPIRMLLLGFVGVVLCGLLDWPSQVLLNLRPVEGQLSDRAYFYQQHFETMERWSLLLPTLVLLMVIPLVSTWLARKFYWITPRVKRSRLRLLTSYLCLLGPPTLLLIGWLHLNTATRQLEWLELAQSYDPYQGSLQLNEVDEYTLKPARFQQLALKDPSVIKSMLRDLSDQEFTDALDELNQQLLDPDFRPTSEDMTLLSFISQRTLLKGEPTPQTIRFALESWKLTNRLRNKADLWPTEQLLEDHLAPQIARADAPQLATWKKELAQLQTYQVSQQDIDALVLNQLEKLATPHSHDEPLRFLGVRLTGTSLRIYAERIKRRAVLLDYSRKRQSVPNETSGYRQAVMDAPAQYHLWPEEDLQRFYGFLRWQMNPEVLDRSLRHLNTFVWLRETRLNTGLYPANLPDFAPSELQYESGGKTAVIRKNRSGEEGGPDSGLREWVLQ